MAAKTESRGSVVCRLLFSKRARRFKTGVISESSLIEPSSLRKANRKETKVASVRAENVAEVVWELKRVDKFGTYTEVATRAGFKPGVAGRTLQTVLVNVQRDWPHLQWWRTIPDDGLVIEDSPLAKKLAETGVALESSGKKGFLKISDFESKLFTWDHQAAAATAASA